MSTFYRRAPRVLTIALLLLAIAIAIAADARAQALDDPVLLPKGDLVVGNVYAYDRWDEYWEGTLKRTNGNIGTLTTRANVIFGAYGLGEGITVMASAPYIWTHASQGVLRDMRGLQDLTLAMKVSAIRRPSSAIGDFSLVGVMAGGMPLTDYTQDFLPLSIGLGNGRLTGRLTAGTRAASGWVTSGSAGYTLRGGITLDRPYYYTDDRMFFTDKVTMPNVFDYSLTSGLARGGFLAVFGVSQQYTLGGGDIRRQDMPFVSNRMNFTKLGGIVQAPLPGIPAVAGQFAYSYTVHGRNVGQGTTLTGGLVYRVRFLGGSIP